MKSFMIRLTVFSLMLASVSIITAQTANQSSGGEAKKSLKSLKNSLAKNSRYGDEVIYWFTPVNFKGCEVSYRFERLNANKAERFQTAVVDRSSPLHRNDTIRTQDLPNTTTRTSTGQTTATQNRTYTDYSGLRSANAQAKVFYNNSFPYYYYGIDRRVFSLEQALTTVDLAEIDPHSIELKSNSKGQAFIIFNSLKNKSAIEKRVIDAAAGGAIEVESDFVPVTGEKSGAKISAAFVKAVNACRQ